MVNAIKDLLLSDRLLASQGTVKVMYCEVRLCPSSGLVGFECDGFNTNGNPTSHVGGR